MAEVIRYVDPDATGTGDGETWTNAYTSLFAWEAAEQTDLVSDGDWHHVYCRASSGTADTTALVIDGWSVGVANYILIEAADGDQAVKTGYDTSIYRLTSSNATILLIRDNYVRINGIQFGLTITADNNGKCIQVDDIVAGGCDIRIENCWFEAVSMAGTGSGMGVQVFDNASVVIVINCIANNFVSGTDTAFRGFDSDQTTNFSIYNSIAYNCYYGFRAWGGAQKITNCASFNNTDDFSTESGTLTIDHCASDDGDGTNAVAASGSDWDNEFTDPAGGDFTLLNSGNCYHGGSTGPDTALYTTDMEGDTYNSAAYSIGVDEYVASGGTTYTIIASTGSIALSGTDVDLLYDRLISADSANYAVTGTDADLLYNRLLSAETGSIIVNGDDVDLIFRRVLSTESGPYTLTGTDADFLFNRLLSADSGAYTLTGQDASLRWSRGYLLTAEAGSYTLSGSDISLLKKFKLLADSGVHALTGQDVAFMRKYIIDAGLGQITLSGKNATLSYSGIPIAVFPISATITETAAVLAAISANMILSDLTESIITGVLDDNS